MPVTSTISHVEVETQTGGTVVVRWKVEGDPVAVDVATGPSPDRVDHEHQATVPAEETSIVVPAAGRGRLYVSVAPHGRGPAVVAADRRVPFEGVTNFRDLGGYRTRDGGRLRWGRVFRADSLHGLTEADLALYERLGLRAVYDLRSESERNERPNPVSSLQHTITGRPQGSLPDYLIANGIGDADGEQLLETVYVGMLDHSAAQIGRLYEGLAGDGGLPAVFHCHAGKDRTGVVAALLLEALGVERADILDDYELTSRYRLRVHQEWTFERLLKSGLAPEVAAGVLSTPRWAMERALAHLDEHYGGIDAFLTGPAGMSADAVETLRRRLVEADTAG